MATKATLSTATQWPRIIFSGIQPTGIPHLGNYLGALSNWANLQSQPDGKPTLNYYSIVDLHAITMPQNAEELRKAKLDMAASLLACGVDPTRSVLFEQSRVKAHAELAWIFNCITPVGWLGRMTQWKSKMNKGSNASISHAEILADTSLTTGLKMGLFDYPVLQAADILLYKATHVPVGQDQIQHLELARDIAGAFNKTFKHKIFPKPNAILPPATKRIMSLQHPTNKMSKSDRSEDSRINLTDTPEKIHAKIRRAVTDSIQGVSYDVQERPGVSNLLSIYSAVREMEIEEAVKDFEGVTSTKVFKDRVADAIVERLMPIQKELERLRGDMGYVINVLDEGARKAENVAEENMQQVYKVVGLR